MPKAPNPNLSSQLMTVAVDYIETHGRADFSMKWLSREVGYAVTAVYRCFESRGHLLREIQLQFFTQFAQQFSELDNSGDPKDQIIEMGRRFIAWASENPHRYRFMFQETDTDVLLKDHEQPIARSVLVLLESQLQHGRDMGLLRVAEPRVSATMLFASLHGLVSLHLSQRLDSDVVTSLPEFYEHHLRHWTDILLTSPPHEHR